MTAVQQLARKKLAGSLPYVILNAEPLELGL
jgi:hypothetical protein